ncbi:MAG: hypothetical protein V7752_14310 [Halopseudomonas sp.]
MKPLLCLLTGLLISNLSYAKIPSLYETQLDLSLDKLVVEVNGYKVPTRDAFHGWMLINQASDKVFEIRDYFKTNGVKGELPQYLVLLQGTDWRLNQKSVFVLPNKKNWDNMIRTVKLIEQQIIPVIGDLVPVSGERSEEYNAISGGAKSSKHLNFCAMDLVPEKTIERKLLHQKLLEIHRQIGPSHKMGLGLYSGLRFHIDTCGFRRW